MDWQDEEFWAREKARLREALLDDIAYALGCLGDNLAIAAALCRSHRLGVHSCTCDWGPRGDEWYPGEGHSPEDIKDRRWNHEPHLFNGTTDRCVECNESADSWVHYVAGHPCPECGTVLEHDGNCEACMAKWEAENPPSPHLVAMFHPDGCTCQPCVDNKNSDP